MEETKYVDRLRQALLDCGKSVNAVAVAMGLNPSNLGKFATAKIGMSYENGKALEAYLGMVPTAEPQPCERCETLQAAMEAMREEAAREAESRRNLPALMSKVPHGNSDMPRSANTLRRPLSPELINKRKRLNFQD